jgi:hypothetical protein
MADPLDLTGEIAEAINGAVLRGHTPVLGCVDDSGYAALSFGGQARIDPSTSDVVYAGMVELELEQQQDPDQGGVAVIIEVDSVNGFGAGGPFQMAR